MGSLQSFQSKIHDSCLDLRNQDVTDKHFRQVFRGPAFYPLADLTKLFLQNNNIGAKGIKHLTNEPFDNLSMLILSNNHIGDQGLKYLAKGGLKRISVLGLLNNNINGEGIRYLSDSSFENLSQMYLSKNSIGSEGVKHIVVKGNFRKLKQITIWDPSILKETKSKFKGFQLRSQDDKLVSLLL